MRSFQGYNYQKQTDRYKDKTERMTGKDRAKENQQETKKIVKKNEDNYSR